MSDNPKAVVRVKDIVRMQSGSKVYGCALPTSDSDEIGVFIPDGRQIVLGTPPTTRSANTKTGDGKNTAADTDSTLYSLKRFFELVSQQQVVAMDALFTPPEFIISKNSIWQEILDNRSRLLSKKMSAFVGYAKAQSSRYSLRGDRMLALERVITYLRAYAPNSELGAIHPETWTVGSDKFWEFIKVVDNEQGRFLEVCGKSVGFTAKVKYALDIFENAHKDYGTRAKLAAQNGGDFKACYHAYRISEEAKELLLTGHITFPRPEASILLRIRQGELPYEEVSEMLEEGVQEILEAQRISNLPESPDSSFMNEFVYRHYVNKIIDDHTNDNIRLRSF